LLRKLLQRRGASFLEDVEGWISERETTGESGSVRAGVMIHMFVDHEPNSSEKLEDRDGD
jgi:hypothetical protein